MTEPEEPRTPKMMQRTFTLENQLDMYGPGQPGPHRWANEVIDSIERDELRVYDPKDTEVFNVVSDDSGAKVLETRLSVAVPLRDWLPVACQCVRWSNRVDRTPIASYGHNAATVLWPPTSPISVQGPSAFVGEIAINRHECRSEDEDAFKFVVAHELVHVFDIMKLLVPAFMDWPSFWNHVLNEGFFCEEAGELYHNVSQLVDDYGNDNERAMIAQYWPSQVEKWFQAFRGAEEPKDP